MAKCLVYGANGFIGSHLVDNLVKEGHFVRCFDRYKSGENIYADTENPNIEIFRGDFLSKQSIESSLKDMEYVFHFISTTNPIISENDPLLDIETNIKMSVELFNACTKQKTFKRLIFASTGGAIYGNHSDIETIDESVNPDPVSPYAIGKLTIEYYLRYFEHKHGLDYLVLRISNPYGSRQNTLGGQGVIPIFMKNIRDNKDITVFDDGTMVRDYIYIQDAVDMISACFDKQALKNIYNLSSGRGHTVNEIVDIVQKVIGKKASIRHKPSPSSFIHTAVLDSTRFQKEFKITPKYSLDEGIRTTWQDLN